MRVQVRSLALRVFQASEPRGAEPFREQLAQAIELGLLPLAPGEEQVRQRIAEAVAPLRQLDPVRPVRSLLEIQHDAERIERVRGRAHARPPIAIGFRCARERPQRIHRAAQHPATASGVPRARDQRHGGVRECEAAPGVVGGRQSAADHGAVGAQVPVVERRSREDFGRLGHEQEREVARVLHETAAQPRETRPPFEIRK